VDELTTTELVRLALDDDSTAWSTLIVRYRRVVWAATSGFRFDNDTRDDVFQLTWLRLLDNLAALREPERLAGWLATTARRECLLVIRERSRVQPADDLGHDRDAGIPDHDADLIRTETVRHVAEALDGITPECRELLRLLSADSELGYSEIAEILGWPIGSIGPKRARCLKQLGRQPSIARITRRSPSSDRAGGQR
jgi:RNA polymerase sigma factor (sigma-70 family)